MGQEIFHCSLCGLRLRSTDFEHGEALKVDLAAYCKKCAPQVVPPDSNRASSTSTRRRKTSTARIPIVTPRRAMEAAGGSPPFPPGLLWGGGGILLALVIAAALAAEAGPAPRLRNTRAPAGDGAAGDPRPAPPSRARAPPGAGRGRSGLDPGFAAGLPRSMQGRRRRGQGSDAFRSSPRRRAGSTPSGGSPESAAQPRPRRQGEAIHLDLVGKLDQARKRGADAGGGRVLERLAKWDLPGYGAPAESRPPCPAPPPATAAPAPAPVRPRRRRPQGNLIPFVAGPRNWTLLTTKRATSTEGAVLTTLEDGSILASGRIHARAVCDRVGLG
jgi:hypothetical protein